MRNTNLPQHALALTPPWTVTRSAFDPEAHRLDIQIELPAGSRFPCPDRDGVDCQAHVTGQMT